MRTIKILFVATTAMFCFTLFSCEDESGKNERDTTLVHKPGKLIYGTFTVSSREEYRGHDQSQVSLHVEMDGEGDFEEFGQAHIKVGHQKIIDNINEKVRIGAGEFTIWNDSGSEIYGNIKGLTLDGNNKYQLVGSIFGGSGKFEHVYGSLKIDLVNQEFNQYQALAEARVHNMDEQPQVP